MVFSRRVLLVEGEPDTNDSICAVLEQHGYTYYCANTLAAAVEIIKRESVDIILCDLNLPDGSGLELLEILKKMLIRTPFVGLTQSGNVDLLKEALVRGASDYLPRPFNLQNLPTIIERNLERYNLDKKRNFADNGSVMLKAIKALITALEAKDRYTSGHSQRVAMWSKRMGEALELSKEDQYTLHLAAILHDIGKIGMPDKILHKSGSLLKMEYRTAKEHTIIGSRIVGEIDELQEVASIIRHHHERFDGKGYPDGLQGRAIPRLARILAIVDAYEAIVSQRTYREKQPSEIALEELAMHSGRQFDPELVEIFVDIVQKEIKSRAKQLCPDPTL